MDDTSSEPAVVSNLQVVLKKIRDVSLSTVIIFLISVLLLALVEGIASILLFVKASLPISESGHTQPDPLLGWVSQANLFLPNKYGKGVFFQTNSQGFRNSYDFSQTVPQDKIRIICLGDSFTMGYGVDNEHTWCASLETKNTRYETVNMGQGGYGADQAYLWYLRDGVKLNHQLLVLAVIGDDFTRMWTDSLYGYRKPLLGLKNQELGVINYPLAMQSNSSRQRIALAGSQLRLVAFFQKLADKFPVLKKIQIKSEAQPGYSQIKQQTIVKAMLKQLKQTTEQKNAQFLLVYLPTREDLVSLNAWRILLSQMTADLAIDYLDLTPEFLELKPAELESLFAGHYTAKGNDFVADKINIKLPQVLSQTQETNQ